MGRVTPPDLELWLTGHGREQLPQAEFDNKFPTKDWPPMLVVVRDDSGPRTSHVGFERRVGFTVVGGTRSNDKPVADFARLALAVFSDPDLAFLDGPITAVIDDDINGPLAVTEPQDRARRYFTVGYSVIGSI